MCDCGFTFLQFLAIVKMLYFFPSPIIFLLQLLIQGLTCHHIQFLYLKFVLVQNSCWTFVFMSITMYTSFIIWSVLRFRIPPNPISIIASLCFWFSMATQILKHLGWAFSNWEIYGPCADALLWTTPQFVSFCLIMFSLKSNLWFNQCLILISLEKQYSSGTC